MILSTKQVDNIAISENLFHDVVEEHIPNLIHKQTEMLNTFFDNLTSFIEDYLKRQTGSILKIKMFYIITALLL